MSPEQAAGKGAEAGPGADIFGLGAILFEILTGVAPHARHLALPMSEMLARIVVGPVARARVHRPDVPAALDAVCAKALAHRPEDRYESVLQLVEDVRRWKQDEPVSVYREPRRVRLRRWALRHRRLTLSSAALATALSCALLAFSVAAWRDGAAVEERTKLVLETRAEMQRGDLLSDIAYMTFENQARARSRGPRRLVQESAAAAAARRQLAEEWIEQMRERPYLLALSLIDIGDAERTWVRVQRDRTGDPLRVVDAPGARDGKAFAPTLAEVRLGPGPHLLRPDAASSRAEQVDLVVVTALDMTGHDAWVVSRFDFSLVLRQMAKAVGQHDLSIVIRNDAGQLLAAAGQDEAIAFYGGTTPSEAIDPRLTRFFAVDNPEAAIQGWREWQQTQQIPPIAPDYQMTLSNCRPNNDIVHAYKIHYRASMPERHLNAVIIAPYRQLVARTVAGRDFLIVLTGLSVGAVLVVVVLAFKLFARS